MAFELKGLNTISSGMNTFAPTTYAYITNDSAATVELANYFNAAYLKFRENDLIQSSLDMAATPVYKFFRVVSSSISGVVVEEISFGGLGASGIITLTQHINNTQISVATPTSFNIYPPTTISGVATFTLLGATFNYIELSGSPFGVSFLVGATVVHSLDLTSVGPNNKGSFTSSQLVGANDPLVFRNDSQPHPSVTGLYINWILQPAS